MKEQERRRKISISFKRKYENGYINPMKDKIPWNKGLTKEIDKRVVGRNKINREIRYCKCGCNKTFLCKINSNRVFINGHNKAMQGKKHTDKSKYKNKIAHLGKKATIKAKENMSIAQIKRMLKQNKISKPEKELISLLDNNLSKEYQYVGNGQIIIGKFCPDFININGQKKIIELFGCYWHKCKKCKFGNKKILPKDIGRLETYKKYGYKTLIIWEHELKDIKRVIIKLKKFNQEKIKCIL